MQGEWGCLNFALTVVSRKSLWKEITASSPKNYSDLSALNLMSLDWSNMAQDCTEMMHTKHMAIRLLGTAVVISFNTCYSHLTRTSSYSFFELCWSAASLWECLASSSIRKEQGTQRLEWHEVPFPLHLYTVFKFSFKVFLQMHWVLPKKQSARSSWISLYMMLSANSNFQCY